MHILINISRGKDAQTMKFGQLIEYNIINIFLENHAQNMVEKLFPSTFFTRPHSTQFPEHLPGIFI